MNMKTNRNLSQICESAKARTPRGTGSLFESSRFFLPTNPVISKKKRSRGFSLIELLVVVAIIAIIAAIAIPAIGNTNNAASEAKDKRNAQSLASLCMAAQTAGVDFFAAGDLDQTIQNCVTGGTVTDGAFAGEFFGVPGLGADEMAGAKVYLELNNGMLIYKSGG